MTITAIKQATIGQPKTRLGTTIWPIFMPDNSPPNIKIGTDDLVVSELKSASVPKIQVHNPTESLLLIPAGKVLSGGRQTRTVNVSILVGPRSTIIIPVSCVEAGRWHGQRRFADSNRFASRRVRMDMQRSVARNVKNSRTKMSDQRAVWNSINSEMISRHLHSATQDFLYAEESLNNETERFSVVQDNAGGRAVFIRAGGSTNHHDLGLFSIGESGKSQGTGLYHLAWQVDTIDELAAIRTKLNAVRALTGESDHGVSKSLYAQDPDGIEFEIMWMVPESHWGKYATDAIVAPLDIAAEITRWSGVVTAV